MGSPLTGSMTAQECHDFQWGLQNPDLALGLWLDAGNEITTAQELREAKRALAILDERLGNEGIAGELAYFDDGFCTIDKATHEGYLRLLERQKKFQALWGRIAAAILKAEKIIEQD